MIPILRRFDRCDAMFAASILILAACLVVGFVVGLSQTGHAQKGARR